MTTPTVSPPGEEEREATQYLTFVVGGETFGMTIASIHEIIDFGDLTRVPLVPDYIRGVINLRGNVVPVIDLRARLGRGTTTPGKRTSMVIVELPQADQAALTLGVMVDVVNEVIEIEEAEIEPPPPFGTPVRPDFIDGMTRRKGGFMILLDPARVFAVEELSTLETASAPHTPARDGEGATP